jgi:hypothetical protein
VHGISDLLPLEGMPLEYLNLTDVRGVGGLERVSSLKALRVLILDGTGVTDLRPLRGLRLETISLLRTAVSDVTPLQGMPLKVLRLDYQPEREAFVRSFPRLEFINDKPAAAFWKEVAGKELPAELRSQRDEVSR